MKNESSSSRKSARKKQRYMLILLLLLAVVTIGYATLSTGLNINGTSKIKNSTWNVEIPDDDDDVITCPTGETCTINPTNPDDIDPDNGETTPENPNPHGSVIWMDGDTVYFKHLLEKPGDTFTFDVKFENNGTIDAKIAESGIKVDLNTTAKKFLTYTVTYSNGNEVGVGDRLAAGASASFKVTVSYKDTVTTLPTASELAAINGTDGKGAPTSFTVTYEQA